MRLSERFNVLNIVMQIGAGIMLGAVNVLIRWFFMAEDLDDKFYGYGTDTTNLMLYTGIFALVIGVIVTLTSVIIALRSSKGNLKKRLLINISFLLAFSII